jgi:hypothetical protein
MLLSRSLSPLDLATHFLTTTEDAAIPIQPNVDPWLEAIYAHFENQIRAELFEHSKKLTSFYAKKNVMNMEPSAITATS